MGLTCGDPMQLSQAPLDEWSCWDGAVALEIQTNWGESEHLENQNYKQVKGTKMLLYNLWNTYLKYPNLN